MQPVDDNNTVKPATSTLPQSYFGFAPTVATPGPCPGCGYCRCCGRYVGVPNVVREPITIGPLVVTTQRGI